MFLLLGTRVEFDARETITTLHQASNVFGLGNQLEIDGINLQ